MIGRTVSHYRIDAQLGAGGMGVVYRGEDVRLNRFVALKFLSEQLVHDDDAIRRLRAEARAASALNHPSICTIYDVGDVDGQPFIVMELLKGRALRDAIGAGPLKVPQLVDIGIDIADALQAAHSEGIVHRDITPGNIFLTDRGHVKILDFGLAKLTQDRLDPVTTADSAKRTAAGLTLGTIAYMSPEQATGEELDARTDLFSLGVVLYEAATGRHPFASKSSPATLAAILNRAPVAPIALNAELPLRLQEVINNCLEKDRELRYQSAGDLRADLKRVRRDLVSISSPSVAAVSRSGHAGSDGVGRGPSSTGHADRPGAANTSARKPIVAAAAVAMASLAFAAYVWLARTRPIERAVETRAAAPTAPAPSAAPPSGSGSVAQQPQSTKTLPEREGDNSRLTQPARPGTGDERPRNARPSAVPRAITPSASAPSAVPAPSTPPGAGATPPAAPATVQPPPVGTAASVEPLGHQVEPPPPPAPPPATRRDEAPPPQRASTEDDDAAIRRVAASYARAIENKDLALFKSIKPNLSREEERRLEDGFRAVTSQHVALTILSIDRRGDDALVHVKRRDTIDAAGRTQTVDSEQTLHMTRTPAGWVLVAIR